MKVTGIAAVQLSLMLSGVKNVTSFWGLSSAVLLLPKWSQRARMPVGRTSGPHSCMWLWLCSALYLSVLRCTKKKEKKKSCSQYVVKVFSSASAGFLHSWRFYLGMTHFPLLYQNAPFLGGGGEEGNCSQNTQKSLIIALFLHCFFFTSIFIGVCFTNKSN